MSSRKQARNTARPARSAKPSPRVATSTSSAKPPVVKTGPKVLVTVSTCASNASNVQAKAVDQPLNKSATATNKTAPPATRAWANIVSGSGGPSTTALRGQENVPPSTSLASSSGGPPNAVQRGQANVPPTLPLVSTLPPPRAEQSTSGHSVPIQQQDNVPGSDSADAKELSAMSRPRPPAQRVGKQVMLASNHFPFRLRAPGPFHQYSVAFYPEVESKPRRMRLVVEAIEGSIFDGSTLFLTTKMGSVDLMTKQRDVEVKISLAYIGTLSEPPAQLLNILFKQMLRFLALKQIGRQYYDPTKAIDVTKHHLQLWPGYFSSMSADQRGMTLVVDICFKVLRTDTVLDLIAEYRQSGRREWKQAVTQQLVGQIVLTRYNNRTYRIDRVDWELSPESIFEKRSGEQLTYQEYYAKAYNKTLSDLEQPLLVHCAKKKGREDQLIYLVPELCCMTGYTDHMRADFQIMRDLSLHTRPPPMDRAAKMKEFIATINSNADIQKAFHGWQLDIAAQLPPQAGRVLPTERILFGNQRRTQGEHHADWGNILSEERLIAPTPLSDWLLVYPRRNQTHADDFYKKLKYLAQTLGMSFEDPQDCRLEEETANAYIKEIRANISVSTRFIVCLCPNARKDRYDAIKQLLCLEIPIPSQCLLAKSITNPKRFTSTCRSICMQICCKQGGELWQVEVPLPRAMVVGIDVYHDTALGGKRSAVGFCATLNPRFTQYYSRVTFQRQGQEIIDTLHVLIEESLRQYFVHNKSLPERIVIYRDGVGDGMLEAVMEHEVPQFRRAFANLGSGYQPKLAVVVVKKRIHTRLFVTGGATQQTGTRPTGNPPPGTVVDTDICHPRWYDFFLISQAVRNGTVTPTHYHVITDDTGMNPDQMQTLTYKLCHLYYNWPGTISVPAPCQYAHKLAFLVGQSLHKDPGLKLATTLYYL